MAPRKKRNPSPPSTEALNTEGSSSNSSSSSSFQKGKRGRPQKLVISTRSDGDPKNSAGSSALAVILSPSGTSDSTATTTARPENPAIASGEVASKESADPEKSEKESAAAESYSDRFGAEEESEKREAEP